MNKLLFLLFLTFTLHIGCNDELGFMANDEDHQSLTRFSSYKGIERDINFPLTEEQDILVDNAAKVIAHAYSNSDTYRDFLFLKLMNEDGQLNEFFQLSEALSPIKDLKLNYEKIGLTIPIESVLDDPCNFPKLIIRIPNIFQGLIRELKHTKEAPIEDMLTIFTNLNSPQGNEYSKGYFSDGVSVHDYIINTKNSKLYSIPMIIKESERSLTGTEIDDFIDEVEKIDDCPCDIQEIRRMSSILGKCDIEIFDQITFTHLLQKCREFYKCGIIIEDCTNGIDDDGDGLPDCQDSDCCGIQECPPCENVEICADGIDNDGDGFIDEDDYDCCEFYAGCLRDCQDDYNKVTGFHFNSSSIVQEFEMNTFNDQIRKVGFSFITFSTSDIYKTIRQPLFTDYAWNGSFFNNYYFPWNSGTNPEWAESTYGDNCDDEMGYFAVAWMNENDASSSCYYDLGLEFVLNPNLGVHNTDCTYQQWLYCHFPWYPCDCNVESAISGGSFNLKVLGPNYIPVNVDDWFQDWNISVGETVGFAVVIEDVLSQTGQTNVNTNSHTSSTNFEGNFGFGGTINGKDLKIPTFTGGIKFTHGSSTTVGQSLSRTFGVSDWIPYKDVLKYCDTNESHTISTNNSCELINIMETPLDIYDFTSQGPLNLNCINPGNHSGSKHYDDIITAYLTIKTN